MSAVSAKPELRGFLQRHAKKHFLIATALSFSVAGAWYFFYAAPKQRKFEEYYKTYNAEKHLREMEQAGLLQSHPK